MATEKKKHKKRRHNNSSGAQVTEAVAAEPKELARAEKKAQKAKEKEKQAKADAKAGKKPSLWVRFKTWVSDVRIEMQRVVWPTRTELINASLIVVGALVFFGVYIAIIDNIVIIPLNWIASIGG